MRVGSKKHKRGKACRCDSITLRNRFCGVADGIKRVGHITNFLRKICHLGNAAGVVGDGTIGVNRHDNPRHGKHGHGSDGNSIKTGEVIRG